MSRKKYITSFLILFFLFFLSGLVSYYFLSKKDNTENTAISEKSIDAIFEELDNKNKEINKGIESIIEETDFDPEKDSAEVIVEKMDKLEEMSKEVENKLY